MPIALSALSSASRSHSSVYTESYKSSSRRTAFLCHSHLDVEYVKGLVVLLRDNGFDAYVDWMDSSMPATPDRTTADKIRRRIRAANLFLFLATPNSMKSRWCPWEIGFADGIKPVDSILIIPTRADDGTYHGNEYLQLYRKIDQLQSGGLGVWRQDQTFSADSLRSL